MIEIQKLGYAYQKSRPVLTAVDLVMSAGSILGLLGINGAGKSTLLGLLTGQLQSQSGQLRVLDKTFADHRNDILRNIALVPQGYAFYPTLTVAENLMFFAQLRDDLTQSETRVADALAFCQLEDYQTVLADTLSGGLKRRLNLAIGVVNQPKLLFLDEPTVGIDPISRAFILKAIQQLNEQGVSIVYTSHHMQEVEQLCDEVAILDQGRILYQGKLSELKQRQGARFSAKICQAGGGNLALTEAFNTFIAHYQLTFQQGEISGVLAADQLAPATTEFMVALNSASAELLSLSVAPMSMEDVFFEIIDPQLVRSLMTETTSTDDLENQDV